MIEHLKLLAHKVLNGAALYNLGKINVICGRNNSGKSTLLEAVSIQEKRVIGMRLTDSEAGQIYHETLPTTAWQTSGIPGVDQEYARMVREACALKELWLADEINDFSDELNRLFHPLTVSSYGPFTFPEGPIKDSYRRLLADRHNVVFVPPKRNLEPRCGLNQSFVTVEPDGHRLLQGLFIYKNQQDNSEQRGIFERIENAFTSISSGYRFDIHVSNDNFLTMHFAEPGGTWVRAQDCGLGLQDLMVILFFAIDPKYDTVLIEEPESHIHPDMQRRLLAFLKSETDKQFFLSTHSNIFLDSTFVDRVFYTSFEGSITVNDATRRAEVLGDLGYSVTDNLVPDAVLLVEGPSDIGVIEEFLTKMGLYGKFNIKIWPLGGDIMDQTDLSVFERNNLLALVDNDPGSKKVRNRFVKKCRALKIPVTHLKRYALENYYSIRSLREVFGPQIPADVTSIADDKKLEEQIGIDVKRNSRRIAREMTLDEIKGTDLERFLETVRKTCEH